MRLTREQKCYCVTDRLYIIPTATSSGGIVGLLIHGTGDITDGEDVYLYRSGDRHFPFHDSKGVLMTEEANSNIDPKELASKDDPLLIDEFEIVELEDRLELAGRCNGRCDAP